MSEYEPITAAIRKSLDASWDPWPKARVGLLAKCDAIDAVHAALERENAELRERVAVLDNERGNMHDGGSITDELRCWYKDRMFMGNGWQELDNIADRIDAEHERMIGEWDYWESTHVELPKDADGVPIRVGDEVVDELDESTAPRKVTSLYLANDGWWVYIGGVGRRPDRYSHHHAPTVEDVLREMADRCYADEDEPRDRDAIVAEFAAKLRLAGEVDG